MSRGTLIALLLGLLLLAAPVARVAAEEDDYAGEEEDDGGEDEAADASEKDVVVLTSANFDDTIKAHKFVLTEFYAPWCGHCKSLAPHYAKAATILKATHDADVVLAKIDATEQSELATKYGVQGYPTLKWFVDGSETEYKGPRDADGIVAWIKKKTGPATQVVDSAEVIKELEADNPAIAVVYKAKPDVLDTFKAVAQTIEDVVFVETADKAVAKAAGLDKAEGGVGIIKNFAGEDRATAKFGGKATDKEALAEWVNGEKMPLTLEFNEVNSDKIFNSGVAKQLLLWAAPADLAQGSKVFELYKKVAAGFKGKLVFVTVNNEGESHEPVTNFFGLKSAGKGPVVLGFHMEANKKFKLPEAVTEASLKTFAQGVLDGTAPIEYKSAPIPDEPTDGDVAIVVGKTVEGIVFDESKDVLLEVYAPWCGHCKKLDPIYKKLAKRFKKVDSVVIAKMDGTENEHPDIEVKGFPTIVFVPAGGRTIVPFEEGDRSLKALTKFIKANAAIPYELPKKGGAGGEDGESAAASAKDEL